MITYTTINKSLNNFNRVYNLLIKLDNYFHLSFSSQEDNLITYTKKIVLHANITIASNEKVDIGLVAIYCNDDNQIMSYITVIAVDKYYQGQRIGQKLIDTSIKNAKRNGFKVIKLEVNINNIHAIDFYTSHNFKRVFQEKNSLFMEYVL